MALTDNLISFWPLDESSGTAADSQSGYTLADHNGTTSGTGLVYPLARSFSAASSQYLDVADNADLRAGDVDFTVAAWVKLASKTVQREIAGKADGTSPEWILSYSAAVDRFRMNVFGAVSGGSGTAADDGGGFGNGSAPSTGTWYFVVAWHDSVADTVNIQTSANAMTAYPFAHSAGVYANASAPFNVGRNGNYFAQPFDGLIGPAMFWKRVLTSGERTSLYNGGAGLTYAAMAGGGGTPIPVFMHHLRQQGIS